MKDSPSPPPAPDPVQTAGAQTQSNLQTAIANARLNRVNQTTPWGSINYTEGPVDANGVPTYSSNIQLSPQQQQLLDQQQGMQLQRGGIAQNLLNQTGNSLGKPLDLSGIHGINDRGQNYQGAINRPQMAPGGMPDSARMMQAMGGAAGQIGASGAQGAAGGGMGQMLQMLLSNPQAMRTLQQHMQGQGGGNGGAPMGGAGMTQAPNPFAAPGAPPVNPMMGGNPAASSMPGMPMGGGMGMGGSAGGSMQQKLAELLRAQ